MSPDRRSFAQRVKVGRSVPRKKKKEQVKDEKPHVNRRNLRRTQVRTSSCYRFHASSLQRHWGFFTQLGSSGTKAGPSTSHAAESTSEAGPSNSQAGPSNAALVGRSSSFAQSNTGSDDSWDDMYCCDKCVDYGCFGPRENRERFRPWKKKSRATMEAEKQAKTAKKRKHHRKHRTTKVAEPSSVVHPPHHLDPQSDSAKAVSPASPAAQEAERQRIALYLKEHNKQLLRQLDDAVAAKEKAEAERDALEKNVEVFFHSGDESRGLLERQRPTGTEYLAAHCNPSVNNDFFPTRIRFTKCGGRPLLNANELRL
jgi:hypothetical protein